jgi:cytochrome c peroxidase
MVIVATLILCGHLTACSKNQSSKSDTTQTPSNQANITPPPAQSKKDADDVYQMQMKSQPDFKKMQAVGKDLFFDNTLSASGKMSCASCHNPQFAFGPPNALATQLGGSELKTMGNRAVPSLRYQQNVPAFTEHHFDEDIDESIDQGAVGGHDWDGRAPTLHAQSALPLLAANEMANKSEAEVVAKLRKASYANAFKDTFGAHALDDDHTAFKWTTLALEMYQQDPAQFYPYSSKYDAYLRKQTILTAQEMRGLAAFNAKDKGNCASCHVSRISNSGTFPAFSDFGILAVGVPRNIQLPLNQDPNYYDLGACGPMRTDLKGKTQYCGAFRTPSLRNVALRKTFFHNGQFHDLKQVIDFYNTRETNPGKWYPKNKDGSVQKYDDLPAAYHANVNMDAPFDHKQGDKPPLSDAEIRDMVVFLGTLTDGYQPPKK